MVVAASTAVTPAAETSAPSVLRSTRDLAVGAAHRVHRGDRRDLAARRPGSQAASIVIRDADDERGDDRAGGDDQRAVRDDRAGPVHQRPHARADADADAQTGDGGDGAHEERLQQHGPGDLAARGAYRARSSASSLVRWATSIVKVLAMMKMPTNRAMPAKTSSIVFMELIDDEIISAWSSASRFAGVGVDRGGAQRLVEVPLELVLARPGRGGHVDLVVRALLVGRAAARSPCEQGQGAAGRDVAVVRGEDAGDGGREHRSVDGHPHLVADLVPGPLRGLRVQGDLVLARGAAPSVSG